ncbi:MAG: hypothetical protein ABIJ18_02105 [archaeon]
MEITIYERGVAPEQSNPFYWGNIEEALLSEGIAPIDDRELRGFTYVLDGVKIICDLYFNGEDEEQRIRFDGEDEASIRQAEAKLKVLIQNTPQNKGSNPSLLDILLKFKEN